MCVCVWSSGHKEQLYCLHSKVRGTGTWKAPLIQTLPSNGYTWHAGDNSPGKEWKGAGQLSGTLSKKEGETEREAWERKDERKRGREGYMEKVEVGVWLKQLIWEEFCYFCRYNISMNEFTFCWGWKIKKWSSRVVFVKKCELGRWVGPLGGPGIFKSISSRARGMLWEEYQALGTMKRGPSHPCPPACHRNGHSKGNYQHCTASYCELSLCFLS